MTGAAWTVSYALLWVTVLVLSIAVVVLLRQIGVLHARVQPLGVHHANRGPTRGELAPPAGVEYAQAAYTLLAFTAPDCPVCHELVPSLQVLARDYPELVLHEVSMAPHTQKIFTAFRVDLTPYLVMVSRDGSVLGGGVANTLEQAELLVEAVREPVIPERAGEEQAAGEYG